MNVKVEKCHDGHGWWHFRCTLPDGSRYNVGYNQDGNDWCRKYATQLRNCIVQHYDIKRTSIKVV